jgi:hypothetical protein
MGREADRRETPGQARSRVPGRRVAAALALSVTLLGAGCAGQPEPLPTIGSPSPSAAQVSADDDRATELARRWDLTGVPLPADWPDVPLPRGTEVVTAYAIGAEPRRTWTATFAADRGTALDLAEPVVAAVRARQYVPIAEYVGAAETNTGLYSFAAPTFAVYVVLGEDDGRPNVVITVRGSADESAGLTAPTEPTAPRGSAQPTATPTGTGTAAVDASASPAAPASPTRASGAQASPAATGSPTPSPTASR